MKCCDCCNYGPILSDEALNDRLYWVEVRGVGCRAAWRVANETDFPWVISEKDPSARLVYADDEIRIIHEIIPED